MTAATARLRGLALGLRTISASGLGTEDARLSREAANELAAIADALDEGGAIVGDYVVAPVYGEEVRGVPIPPPPQLSGKHHRPTRAEAEA